MYAHYHEISELFAWFLVFDRNFSLNSKFRLWKVADLLCLARGCLFILTGCVCLREHLLVATSGTLEDHLKMVGKVLSLLHEEGIKIQAKKLQLCSPTIEFLGVVWDRGTLKIPSAKIQGIQNMKQPSTPRQLKSLICSLSYYRKFIPNFSQTAFPLLEATKLHHTQFQWTDEMLEALEKLKSALSESTCLYVPNPDKPFFVQTDASFYCGAGQVYQFDDENRQRLLCCVSRTFTKAERKYGIFRKEVLALLYSLKCMDHFLRFAPKITAVIDAKSIIYLRLCKDSEGILLRFSLALAFYDLQVIHKSSKENFFSDTLSRLHADIHQIKHQDRSANPMTEAQAEQLLSRLTLEDGYRFTTGEVKELLQQDSLPNPQPPRKRATTKKQQTQNAISPNYNKPATVPEKKKRLPKTTEFRPGFIPIPHGFPINHMHAIETQQEITEHELVQQHRIAQSGRIPVQLFIQHQRKCPQVGPKFAKPTSKHKFENGIIMYHQKGFWKPCLPSSLIENLVTHHHYTLFGIHKSASRIARDILLDFYYPEKKLYDTIRTITDSCTECQHFKLDRKPHQYMYYRPVESRPRAAWAIDLIIGLPITPTGNYKAIMLMTDIFSLYLQLAPLQSKEGDELLLNFQQYIHMPFGLPSYIRVDGEQGISNSKSFKEFCEMHGIKLAPTAARAPWSNGQAERMVAVVKDMLKPSFPTNPFQKDWQALLPYICQAHNTSVSYCGYSPQELMFGNRLPPPTNPIHITHNIPSVEEYATTIFPAAKEIRDKAAEQKEKHRQRVTQYHNTSRKQKQFQIGDVVLLRDLAITQGSPNTLKASYKGPFTIKSIEPNSSSCKIINSETSNELKVHFEHLRHVNYNPRRVRIADQIMDLPDQQ